MQQQQQVQDGPDQMKMVLGATHFVCRSLAATLEIPLHRWQTMGARYLGLQAAAAILLLFFYTAFWRGDDIRPVLGFLMFYVATCACARLGTMRRVGAGGPQVHSYYSGTPRIMRFVGRMSEETVKRIVEPMLVFVTGALVLQANVPLGTYLMLAAGGLFASVNLTAGFDRTRALDMNDAFLDQSNVAERLREMRGQ